MGLLGGDANVNIEASKPQVVFVDKSKQIIVCNKCEGTGREYDYRLDYGRWRIDMNGISTCRWCKGAGTIQLKSPKVKK